MANKVLEALKGIATFPGTLKDLLIEFEQRITTLENSPRVAAIETAVADVVQTVSDIKAAVMPPKK